MKRPTKDDCLRLLAAQADPAVPPFAWRIEGVPYSREDALDLAELSLLLKMDLSSGGALTAVLTLARRLADLEEAFDAHDSVRRRRSRIHPESGVAQPSDGNGWI
jgi:hypothetical protein